MLLPITSVNFVLSMDLKACRRADLRPHAAQRGLSIWDEIQLGSQLEYLL
jgi:hypothetical protein